jgi:hypothetical protein
LCWKVGLEYLAICFSTCCFLFCSAEPVCETHECISKEALTVVHEDGIGCKLICNFHRLVHDKNVRKNPPSECGLRKCHATINPTSGIFGSMHVCTKHSRSMKGCPAVGFTVYTVPDMSPATGAVPSVDWITDSPFRLSLKYSCDIFPIGNAQHIECRAQSAEANEG